jgi:hypothetical protein
MLFQERKRNNHDKETPSSLSTIYGCTMKVDFLVVIGSYPDGY